MKGAQKPRKISGATSNDWQKNTWFCQKLWKFFIYQEFVFDSPSPSTYFSKSTARKKHFSNKLSRVIPGTPNNGMGIVWEAYHKGVPLLGVPENPIEIGSFLRRKLLFWGQALLIQNTCRYMNSSAKLLRSVSDLIYKALLCFMQVVSSSPRPREKHHNKSSNKKIETKINQKITLQNVNSNT